MMMISSLLAAERAARLESLAPPNSVGAALNISRAREIQAFQLDSCRALFESGGEDT